MSLYLKKFYFHEIAHVPHAIAAISKGLQCGLFFIIAPMELCEIIVTQLEDVDICIALSSSSSIFNSLTSGVVFMFDSYDGNIANNIMFKSEESRQRFITDDAANKVDILTADILDCDYYGVVNITWIPDSRFITIQGLTNEPIISYFTIYKDATWPSRIEDVNIHQMPRCGKCKGRLSIRVAHYRKDGNFYYHGGCINRGTHVYFIHPRIRRDPVMYGFIESLCVHNINLRTSRTIKHMQYLQCGNYVIIDTEHETKVYTSPEFASNKVIFAGNLLKNIARRFFIVQEPPGQISKLAMTVPMIVPKN